MMASKVIQVRQRFLIDQLVVLSSIKDGEPFSALWSLYWRLNVQLTGLCPFISAYSSYLKTSISLIYPFCIVTQCYMLYINIYGERVTLVLKLLFASAILEVNLFLFGLTEQCARVVKANKQIQVENLKSGWKIAGKMQYLPRVPLKTRKLLKVQAFQNHQRLGPYIFRLTGDYPINSNTFNMVNWAIS